MASLVGVNPCTAYEAIDRMRSMVGVDMPYRYGSGDYAPRQVAGGIVDEPWTADRHGVRGCDCAGAAQCFAYKLRRSRAGFNRNREGAPRLHPCAIGSPPSVVDDINTNSAIEDSEYARELYLPVPIGEAIIAGDLLMYPTIQLWDAAANDWKRNADGSIKQWIGHVQMALEPNGTKSGGPYADCMIAQCCGGEDRRPAIVIGHATHMDEHDREWPKFEHRVKVIRVRADIAIVG